MTLLIVGYHCVLASVFLWALPPRAQTNGMVVRARLPLSARCPGSVFVIHFQAWRSNWHPLLFAPQALAVKYPRELLRSASPSNNPCLNPGKSFLRNSIHWIIALLTFKNVKDGFGYLSHDSKNLCSRRIALSLQPL